MSRHAVANARRDRRSTGPSAERSSQTLSVADLIARHRETLPSTPPLDVKPVGVISLDPPTERMAPTRLPVAPVPERHLTAAELIARHRATEFARHRANQPAATTAPAATDAPATRRHAAPSKKDQASAAAPPKPATAAPTRRHAAPTTRPTLPRPALPAFVRPVPIKVIARPALVVAAIVATVAAVDGAHLTHTRAAADSSSPQTPTSSASTPGVAGSSAKTVTSAAPSTTAALTPLARATTTRISRAKRTDSALKVQTKPGQTVAGVWVKPNPGPMTSCFCQRWGAMHWGIDLAGPLGSAILAVGDGVVLQAGPQDGFGNWVVVQHSNGDVSIYGHMRYYFVHPGQKVKAGQKIALVGDEGQSTGPHLHFEVHRGGLDGVKIDPVPWLKARGISVGPYDPNG